HPDYYQIPVADRQALIAEDERAQRAAEAEADRRAGRRAMRSERAPDQIKGAPVASEGEAMSAAAELTVPPEEPTEALAADAGSPGEPPEEWGGDADSPAGVAAEPVPLEEPIPLEPAADAPTSAVAAEPPIELAQLESTSASEPLPTGEAHTVESLAAETAEV